jgi:hypothetical protein
MVMGPEIKNYCAGEDLQQIYWTGLEYTRVKLQYNKYGTFSHKQIPPVVEVKITFPNGLGTIVNDAMNPEGVRNQARLYWRVPAAIYWTGLDMRQRCGFPEPSGREMWL